MNRLLVIIVLVAALFWAAYKTCPYPLGYEAEEILGLEFDDMGPDEGPKEAEYDI